MTSEGKQTPPRFGVFDVHSGARVGTFSLDIANDRFVGSSSAGAPDIRTAIGSALLAFQATGRPADMTDPTAWLESLFNVELDKIGLIARQIAREDIVFNARLDPPSGSVVGRISTAEGVEAFSPEIQRGLGRAITEAAEAFSAQLASKVATAVSAGDHREAARFLEEARTSGGLSPALGEKLGEALAGVDASALKPDEARRLLLTRAALFHRLNRHDLAAGDAGRLLADCTDLKSAEVQELRSRLDGLANEVRR